MRRLSDDQDYNLWALLAQTRHAAFKARQKELDRYNIRPRRAAILYIIQAIGDEATPAEISRWSFREPHSTSVLLGAMEKEGLIKKSKNLHRKNQIRVELTEKGREAYNQTLNRESIHEIMSCLSEEEHQQLRVYLEKLLDKTLKWIAMRNGVDLPPS
ncbi:MarR family winged helix-turn-helix transcriptional regulator [Chloroflexota bacterium]